MEKKKVPFIVMILIISAVVRLIIALSTDQINHADEIFQYVEQAHRLAFDYGYEPWEYRYGIRSFIIPGLLSVPLRFFDFLNIDSPQFYVPFFKLLFSLFSLSLVWSVYKIGRELFSEKAGRCAAIFSCFWYEFLVTASKPTPEILAMYLMVTAVALILSKPFKFQISLISILLFWTVLLRLQYAPPVGVLWLITLFKYDSKAVWRDTILWGTLSIGIAGAVDIFTLGTFGESYYKNYLYNKVYNIASLFGVTPFYYYMATLFVASLGLWGVVGLTSLKYCKRYWLPLVIIVAVVIPHSMIPHKEYRFVIAAVPFLVIILADLGVLFAEKLPKYGRWIAVSILVGISLLGASHSLPFQKRVYKYALGTKSEIFQAYLSLSKESSAETILNLSETWNYTGGYFYLHKDIPIYYDYHFPNEDVLSKSSFMTHIICPVDLEPIENFEVLESFGNTEIRVNQSFVRSDELPGNTKILLQEGIDGVFPVE